MDDTTAPKQRKWGLKSPTTSNVTQAVAECFSLGSDGLTQPLQKQRKWGLKSPTTSNATQAVAECFSLGSDGLTQPLQKQRKWGLKSPTTSNATQAVAECLCKRDLRAALDQTTFEIVLISTMTYPDAPQTNIQLDWIPLLLLCPRSSKSKIRVN